MIRCFAIVLSARKNRAPLRFAVNWLAFNGKSSCEKPLIVVYLTVSDFSLVIESEFDVCESGFATDGKTSRTSANNNTIAANPLRYLFLESFIQNALELVCKGNKLIQNLKFAIRFICNFHIFNVLLQQKYQDF